MERKYLKRYMDDDLERYIRMIAAVLIVGSIFLDLPFLLGYFSFNLFSFSGIFLLNVLIFLLRLLCLLDSEFFKFFIKWNEHLCWVYPNSVIIALYLTSPSVTMYSTFISSNDVFKNIFDVFSVE